MNVCEGTCCRSIFWMWYVLECSRSRPASTYITWWWNRTVRDRNYWVLWSGTGVQRSGGGGDEVCSRYAIIWIHHVRNPESFGSRGNFYREYQYICDMYGVVRVCHHVQCNLQWQMSYVMPSPNLHLMRNMASILQNFRLQFHQNWLVSQRPWWRSCTMILTL